MDGSLVGTHGFSEVLRCSTGSQVLSWFSQVLSRFSQPRWIGGGKCRVANFSQVRLGTSGRFRLTALIVGVAEFIVGSLIASRMGKKKKKKKGHDKQIELPPAP